MKSILKRLNHVREAGATERGAATNLVELVLNGALIMVICGMTFFAASTITTARGTALVETADAVVSGGVSNAFRSDIETAKAVSVDSSNTVLKIARANGSCVEWSATASSPLSESNGKLLRAESSSGAVTSMTPRTEFKDNLVSGSFSSANGKVDMKYTYQSEKVFEDTAKILVAGSGAKSCW